MSKGTKKRVWLGVAALVALQIYFVRELIAAELLFALLFGILLGLGFFFFLLEEITGPGFAWAESRATVLKSAARRQLAYLEEIGRRPFRRLRSQPVRESR